jgi:hypothetical protein
VNAFDFSSRHFLPWRQRLRALFTGIVVMHHRQHLGEDGKLNVYHWADGEAMPTTLAFVTTLNPKDKTLTVQEQET